jgi:hypothetical protein
MESESLVLVEERNESARQDTVQENEATETLLETEEQFVDSPNFDADEAPRKETDSVEEREKVAPCSDEVFNEY